MIWHYEILELEGKNTLLTLRKDTKTSYIKTQELQWIYNIRIER